MIKNIVFDMGGVLLTCKPWQNVLARYADTSEKQQLLYEQVNKGLEWQMRDRGTISLEDAIRSVCTRLPAELHESAEAYLSTWPRWIEPYQPMEELVSRLKEKGYGIYLLSNVNEFYHEFRQRIPALRLFDGEYISSDWHLLKPEREIYQSFVQYFHLVPGQCFFIDDMACNVEMALNCGFKGHVFRNNMEYLIQDLEKQGVQL